MHYRTTRRTFIKQTASTAVAVPFLLSASVRGDSSRKLRHAVIGTARRGEQDLDCFVQHPAFDVVALCDVDKRFLAVAKKRFPKAHCYED